MTLEEKIGQMTQLEIGMVSTGEGDNFRIDPANLNKLSLNMGPARFER